MAPAAIVEDLNVVEERHVRAGTRRPRLAIKQFGLQGGVEALCQRAVQGITDSAHRTNDPRLLESAGEDDSGVLGTVIRVVDHGSGGFAALHGHVDRINYQAATGWLPMAQLTAQAILLLTLGCREPLGPAGIHFRLAPAVAQRLFWDT